MAMKMMSKLPSNASVVGGMPRCTVAHITVLIMTAPSINASNPAAAAMASSSQPGAPSGTVILTEGGAHSSRGTREAQPNTYVVAP